MTFHDFEYGSDKTSKMIWCRMYYTSSGGSTSDLNIGSTTDHGTGDYSFSTDVVFTGTSMATNYTARNTSGSSGRRHAHHIDRDTTTKIAVIITFYNDNATDGAGCLTCAGYVA